MQERLCGPSRGLKRLQTGTYTSPLGTLFVTNAFVRKETFALGPEHSCRGQGQADRDPEGHILEEKAKMSIYCRYAFLEAEASGERPLPPGDSQSEKFGKVYLSPTHKYRQV